NNHNIAAYCVLFAIYPLVEHLRWPGAAHGQQAARGTRTIGFAMSGLFAGFAACNELPALAFVAILGGVLLLRAPKQTLLLYVPAAIIPIAALLATNYIALG